MLTGGFCISQVRKQSPWGLGVGGVVLSALEHAGTELELPSPWGFKQNEHSTCKRSWRLWSLPFSGLSSLSKGYPGPGLGQHDGHSQMLQKPLRRVFPIHPPEKECRRTMAAPKSEALKCVLSVE